MKSLLMGAAALLTTLGMATTAQAYDGPTFSKCHLNTKGASESFLFLNGSASRGTLACQKVGFKGKSGWVKQQVVLPTAGVEIGAKKSKNPLKVLGSLIVRKCGMNVDLTMVGAELNVNLTPTVINRLLKVMVIGEVMNPIKRNKTVAAKVSLNNAEFGGSIGLGQVTYDKDCRIGASVKFGALMSAKAYDRKQAEKAARAAAQQNDN